MMGRNALVLGGGGVLGIAWETGVLAGLAEAGVDVTQADLLVGTSAGSVVATQIGQGRTLGEMVEAHLQNADAGSQLPMGEFDLPYLMSVFQKWGAFPEMTEANCAEIGALSLAAKTVSEDEFVGPIGGMIGSEWSNRDVRLTAVDATTGEFRVWSRDDGVDVRLAVASSCAVPGMFPCVTINGKRYQDGGVRSGTNADVASGCERVLIIAPLGARSTGIDVLMGRQARDEAEALSREGAQVELVFPDAKALEAMGVSLMDPALRPATAEAGMRQGRELAALVQSSWALVR